MIVNAFLKKFFRLSDYMPPVLIPTQKHGRLFFWKGAVTMFDLECVLAFAKEIPTYLDMFVRLCIELANHALGILNAM
jgi:hypothetical protein